MSALDNQPTNPNFLSPLGFGFQIKKTPHVNYFVQSVNLPSVTMGETVLATPFRRTPLQGDVVEYGQLQITFRVDEDMRNYEELLLWIQSVGKFEGFPSYPGYTQTSVTGEGIVSDGVLIIQNSAKQPAIQFDIINMYPSTLSDLQFDSQLSDVDYVQAIASFNFERFTMTRI